MSGAGRIIGIAAVLASTGAEAGAQLCFKRAANHGESRGFFGNLIANAHWILLGWGAFGIDALLWSIGLFYLDVSIAHPIGSIVFVEVALASHFVLSEKLVPRRVVGIGLILMGSLFVASS